MKNRRTPANYLTVILLCVVMALLSPTILGGSKTVYEVRPEVTVPAYRTDAARAIDAYEKLMDRYMDIQEKTQLATDANISAIAQRLDSIDLAVADLSKRFLRIEKALGIEPEKTAPVDPNAPETVAAPETTAP